jgi:hypothetical protein
MAITDGSDYTGRRPADPEVDAVLEEVIDASLHTDRAHHDELGRTEEPVNHQDEAPPSPREQPATPIDIQKIDE